MIITCHPISHLGDAFQGEIRFEKARGKQGNTGWVHFVVNSNTKVAEDRKDRLRWY